MSSANRKLVIFLPPIRSVGDKILKRFFEINDIPFEEVKQLKFEYGHWNQSLVQTV